MSGFEFSRNQILALVALIGLSAIGLSISYGRKNASAGTGRVVLHEPAADGVTVTASGSDQLGAGNRATVVVHVTGCVNAPNVYTLPAGSRVMDAINAAGGAKPGADLDALNLAEKAQDGTKICVPAKMAGQPPMGASSVAGPVAPAASPARSSVSSSEKLKTPGEGVVHINSAGPDELTRLPGVGPATAQKIIAYRNQIGRFSRPEQLVDVKGIGPKTYEKMKPFVAL